MGSLVPGWDSALPGRPSKEWEDFDEGVERPKGYFERYNELKASRKNIEFNVGSPEDVSATADQQGLARSSSRSLSRSGSIPYDKPARHLSPERHLQHSQSTGSHGQAGPHSPKGAKADQDRWWCRLSSAVLNEPDASDEGRPGAKTSTYMPQYGAIGQRIHYRLNSESDDTEELLRKIFPPGAHDDDPEPAMQDFSLLSTSAPAVISATR